ncbi:uncharacterized protein LOC134207623 isoform X1 [Armigeres subalbatus]|uniref:uncharacterized protein LOC134207623 isoform X1 n=1 Tax=Armigeres subalbatus TaxID=124917 RepID=UPI002ED2B741
MVAIKTKTVRIRIGYDRTLHKISLESLEDNIKYIEKIIHSFKTVEHLEQTLQEKLTIAKEKLFSLSPSKTKRALINVLGAAIKFIAGNPVNEDLEIIHEGLEILKNQENKLVQNQIKRIQINELFKNKINNITDSLRKISSTISREFNTVQNLRSDLEFINLIWNTDRIIHILESIEEQVEFSRLGLINKNILSLNDKQAIAGKLRKQNIHLNYLDEIFQYCSATTGINGGQAMVLVKTPVLDDKDFDLLELHTLKVNNSRIKTDINLVAKHGNLIYAQTTKCDICEGTKLIEDECIYNILTHQTPKCTLKTHKKDAKKNHVEALMLRTKKLEEVEATDGSNSQTTRKDPGQKRLKLIPEPRFELLKHQTRMLDT